MGENDIDKAIQIKQIQLQGEQDPIKKQDLNNQLRKLHLQKEIELIKKKIDQLS